MSLHPLETHAFFFLQHLVQNSLHWLSNIFFFFYFYFPCEFLLFIRLHYLVVFKSVKWSGHSLSWVSSLQRSAVSWDWDGKRKPQGTFAPPAEHIEFVLVFLPLGSLFISPFSELGDSHWALMTQALIWEATLQSRIKTGEIRVISCICLIVSYERWLR